MAIFTNICHIDSFDHDLFLKNKIGVEIQTFPQHLTDTEITLMIDLWKEKLIDYKGALSLHGASFDLNPGSTDSKIVEVTRFRYLQSIDIAKKLKANHVIFHSQINPLISVKKIREVKLMNQIHFWNTLLDTEIPSEITVLIENEYDETFDDIKRICDGVNKANFGICLDIGHVLAYSNASLEEWFSNLGHRIKYIHLHWNDGTKDEHKPPTNDEILVMKKLLKKHNLNPIITLEYAMDDLYKEVNTVRDLLL